MLEVISLLFNYINRNIILYDKLHSYYKKDDVNIENTTPSYKRRPQYRKHRIGWR